MKQILKGRVVSVKTPKTVTVLISKVKVHPFYGKAYLESKKYLAHDELGATLGDVVEIIKVRPVSKNKHFQVSQIVGKDIKAVVSEQLKQEAAEEIAEAMPAGRQVMPEKEDNK